MNADGVSFLLTWGSILAWCWIAYENDIIDVGLAAVAMGALVGMRGASHRISESLKKVPTGYLLLLDIAEILNATGPGDAPRNPVDVEELPTLCPTPEAEAPTADPAPYIAA